MGTGEHDSRLFEAIWRRASGRYAGTGTISRQFAAGKLKADPIYRELFVGGILPAGDTLVDIGCGQGLTLAGLAECRALGRAPTFPRMLGIELRPRIAALARQALGDDAEILIGDARDLLPPKASAVLLLDVLHLMPFAVQEAVITRATDALEPDGVIVVREADAAAGVRFLAVRFGNWIKAMTIGNVQQPFHFRSADEWRTRLAAAGLRVEVRAMGTGTPFGNVLLLARR